MSNRSRRQTRTRDLATPPAVPERRVIEKQVCFLGIEDIGSLIYLDHEGRNENPPSRRAAYAIGGTLMGFRPGEPRSGGDHVPAHGNTGHRVLMIQQGTAGGVAHKAPLNHLVKILRP